MGEGQLQRNSCWELPWLSPVGSEAAGWDQLSNAVLGGVGCERRPSGRIHPHYTPQKPNTKPIPLMGVLLVIKTTAAKKNKRSYQQNYTLFLLVFFLFCFHRGIYLDVL